MTDKPYLADPWFHVCLLEAINTPELVENFDRLWGHNLCGRGAPIEQMIDQATGRIDEGVKDFVSFVYEYVYLRVERPETV